MAAAEAAWPAWAALSATERIAIVLKALEGLETDTDERTEILSRENGKIRFEAVRSTCRSSPAGSTRRPQYAPELDVDEHIAGPPFNTTITKLSRPASSRSSTRSTGRWRSSRRPCPPR